MGNISSRWCKSIPNKLAGEFKNVRWEWQPKDQPETARVHDLPQDAARKAIPYDVYDIGYNQAWASVSQDHDTPTFTVTALHRWQEEMDTARGDTSFLHGGCREQ